MTKRTIRDPISTLRAAHTETLEDLDKLLRFWNYGRLAGADDCSLVIELADDFSEEEVLAVVEHRIRTAPTLPEQIIFSNHLDPLTSVNNNCGKFELSPGVFAYDTAHEQRIAKIRSLVHEAVGIKLSYSAFYLPSLIEERYLRAAGYLDNFGPAVLPVSSFQSTYWDAVSGRTPIRHEGAHALCLNPAVCLQFWSRFEDLKPRMAEVAMIEGKVFRNEGGGHTTTRLREFDMLELVGWGSVNHCQHLFETFTEIFKDVLNMVGCPYEISAASDSFVGPDSGLKQTAQLRLGQKYEFRVLVGETKLTVASVNYHAGKFCKAFGFGSDDVQATCCAGIGLQRSAHVLEAMGGRI